MKPDAILLYTIAGVLLLISILAVCVVLVSLGAELIDRWRFRARRDQSRPQDAEWSPDTITWP